MNVTLVLFALLAVDDPSLPARARDVLVKHCGECHGPAGSEKDWGDFATDLSELTQRKRAIAGKPEASRIVVRMSDPVAASRMPPTDAANPQKPIEFKNYTLKVNGKICEFL